MKLVCIVLFLFAGVFYAAGAERECPAVGAGMIGICSEMCQGDEYCSPGFKCCSNGCGHLCTDLRCPVGEPARNTSTSEVLSCGGRVDCPDGHYCEVEPMDTYAVCCACTEEKCPKPHPCETMICAPDEVCASQEACQWGPCDPGAECKRCTEETCPPESDPCKTMVCGVDEVCVQEVQCAWGPCDLVAECRPSLCQLAPAEGPCSDSLRRYYHDNTTKYCMPFWYGGCYGNANNFDSLQTCNDICPETWNGEMLSSAPVMFIRGIVSAVMFVQTIAVILLEG